MRKFLAILAALCVAGTMMLAAPAPAQATTYTLPTVCKGKTGKLLCASKADRRLYAVYNGRIIKSTSVRFGGRASDGSGTYFTREGHFKIYRKALNPMSTLYHVRMPYFMAFSGGQGFHYSAEFARTGYKYGSHGCIGSRSMENAKWFYYWSPVGTKVIVTKY